MGGPLRRIWGSSKKGVENGSLIQRAGREGEKGKEKNSVDPNKHERRDTERGFSAREQERDTVTKESKGRKGGGLNADMGRKKDELLVVLASEKRGKGNHHCEGCVKRYKKRERRGKGAGSWGNYKRRKKK